MFKRMRTPAQMFTVILLVGGCAQLALAQAEDASSETSVEVIPLGPLASPAQAPLPPAEQASRAEEIVASATASCAAQAASLEAARKQNDIIMATCIDDKLTQCNANLLNLKRRQEALQEAIRQNDASWRNHEFTVIGVLDQKIQVLDQAASRCIGQDIFETGDTQVRPEVDPYAPDEDPTVIVYPIPPETIPYIPPPVSAIN